VAASPRSSRSTRPPSTGAATARWSTRTWPRARTWRRCRRSGSTTSRARSTRPARLERHDGHAVARRHVPPLGRGGADIVDHAHDLVAGYEWPRHPDPAGELLVVGAAQPAGLDPEQAVVVADPRNGEAACLEPARLLQHERPDLGAVRRVGGAGGHHLPSGLGATTRTVPWAAHTVRPSLTTSMRTTAVRFDRATIVAVASRSPPLTGAR